MQTSLENVASNAERVAPDCGETARRKRMLVVGETLCAQETADALAGWMDMDVETAENDWIACILATISLAEDRPYEAVLIDVQMPDASTLEAAKWLRRHGWLSPIIATGDQGRKHSLEAGCDDFIDEPLTEKKLQAAYTKALKQNAEMFGPVAADYETTSTDDKCLKPHGRALVVEDALCMQAIVGALLQKMKFEVEMADNGQVACDMAMQSLADGRPYDVILMDIQMPKMNGKQAAKWLRENNWKGPIIAISSHATPKDHAAFLTAGCNDCLTKPISKDTLCSAVLRYVQC